MKNVQFIFSIITVFSIIGCHSHSKTQSDRYPEAFVGTWLHEESGWSLAFENDGEMSMILRDDGLVMDLNVGGRTIEFDNVIANYVFGSCVWSFEPKAGILKAIVTIEDMYVRALDAELSCTLIDVFEGSVTNDGKTWVASWDQTTKWHDGTPDQVISGRKLDFILKP